MDYLLPYRIRRIKDEITLCSKTVLYLQRQALSHSQELIELYTELQELTGKKT